MFFPIRLVSGKSAVAVTIKQAAYAIKQPELRAIRTDNATFTRECASRIGNIEIILYIIFGDKTIIILMKKRYPHKKNSYEENKPSSRPGEITALDSDIPSIDAKAQPLNGYALTVNAKRKRRKKTLLIIFIITLLLPFAMFAIVIGVYAIWASGVDYDSSLLPTSSALPRFYDADGEPLEYKQDNYITPDEIPEDLRDAFVAVEDKRFYSHRGYDVKRIVGAVVHNIKAGGIKEGASTITQQLVKNTYLSGERTLKRKLTEIALAAKLEKQYSKDEILSMYLSIIYFGSGAYGVKQASRTFFGKEVDCLTLAECATLAGIVRNPAGYSPKNKRDNCVSRRNIVLKLMREQGYIDESEFSVAGTEALNVADVDNSSTIDLMYVNEAIDEVCEALGITRCQLDNSGLKIYTALDRNLSKALGDLDKSLVSGDGVNSASVVVDSDGFVVGLSSTLPYTVRRQAGSVLKPLAVYAPALDRKIISLATPVTDEKINYGGYSPLNFGGIYYGDTTVKQAIAHSMNSVSVKVMDYLGVEQSVGYLSTFGINVCDEDKNYALALGALTNGVTPIEIAAAYSALAAGGVQSGCKFVKYVIDNDKYALDNTKHTPSGSYSDVEISDMSGKRIISRAASALMSVALTDTVKTGTAKTLSALPFQVAAKTGTAQRSDGRNSDGWCASYNDRYTVVVWHGSDEGFDERGGGYPAMQSLKIWQTLSKQCDMPNKIDIDDSVKQVEIDTYSAAKCKHVVAATPNTPAQYVDTEYFDAKNLPDASDSRFEFIPAPEFSVERLNDIVKLVFNRESVYSYTLVREDALGRRVVYYDSGTDGIKTIYDTPLSLGGRVRYTLTCSSGKASSSCDKEVYLSSPYLSGMSETPFVETINI